MGGEDRLYKMARDYYQKQMTQQEIARKYGISRIKVSRLLQQARMNRIVEINLKAPPSGFAELETDLADRFGLDEVVLAPEEVDGEQLLPSLGREAADYFTRSVEGGETVALTWGTALSAFVQALPAENYPQMRIVQMLGGLGNPEAEAHCSGLVGRMAAKLNALGRILPAPGIVSTPEVREALIADANIAAGLEMAAQADLAFIGLGIADPESVLIREGAILKREEVERLKAAGAVADISLRFFDQEGRAVEDPVDQRVIGLSLGEITKIPRIVGVAGGVRKRQAILAALRGSLVDVLISDIATGRWLAEQE